MASLVQDHVLGVWTSLPDKLTVAEALAKLVPGAYGVVTEQEGLPVALVTKEDLEVARGRGAQALTEAGAGLPSAAVVGSQIRMGELLESDAGTLVLEGEARGVIVLGEGNQVVGILTKDRLDTYLAGPGRGLVMNVRRGGTAFTALASDASLGGERTTPASFIRCRTCGRVNQVAFFDSERPPQCANADPAVRAHPLAR